MEEVSFHLETFEGPLDLLLHLISKNKVNIYDIPIAEILSQYMDYLDEMEKRNIEVAGDFMVMAAHLVYIKSKMLLPRHEDEPEEDPRARLVEMLLEYQRIKGVTPYLSEQSEIGRNTFIKSPEPLEPVREYVYRHTSDQLLQALKDMTEKAGRKMPPPISSFAGIVGREYAPVNVQTDNIMRVIAKKGEASFKEMLSVAKNRSELVAVFLAVLELSKDKRLGIKEDGEDFCLVLLPEDQWDIGEQTEAADAK